MEHQSCLIKSKAPLVLDASVAINIHATGCSQDILRSLPNDIRIVDITANEVLSGDKNDLVSDLAPFTSEDEPLLRRVSLTEFGYSFFESLVSGASVETLDDGESATIAYALQENAIALIDERKARKILRRMFPSVPVATTVDLFRHPALIAQLGDEVLSDAVYNALRFARMSVSLEHKEWLRSLLGTTRITECRSLPRAFRSD